MDVWFKTGTNRRRNWFIASNASNVPSPVGRNEQLLALTLLNLSDPQGEGFLKASETCKLSFLSILINACKERSLYIWYYDLLVVNAWKKRYSFFHAIEEILIVTHPRKNSQTCLQNIEVTLETFWKISTSSCHEVPNELSNLLAQIATCSTQTVNQNTNVAAEVCKVPIKRTFGLTVKWLR